MEQVKIDYSDLLNILGDVDLTCTRGMQNAGGIKSIGNRIKLALEKAFKMTVLCKTSNKVIPEASQVVTYNPIYAVAPQDGIGPNSSLSQSNSPVEKIHTSVLDHIASFLTNKEFGHLLATNHNLRNALMNTNTFNAAIKKTYETAGPINQTCAYFKKIVLFMHQVLQKNKEAELCFVFELKGLKGDVSISFLCEQNNTFIAIWNGKATVRYNNNNIVLNASEGGTKLYTYKLTGKIDYRIFYFEQSLKSVPGFRKLEFTDEDHTILSKHIDALQNFINFNYTSFIYDNLSPDIPTREGLLQSIIDICLLVDENSFEPLSALMSKIISNRPSNMSRQQLTNHMLLKQYPNKLPPKVLINSTRQKDVLFIKKLLISSIELVNTYTPLHIGFVSFTTTNPNSGIFLCNCWFTLEKKSDSIMVSINTTNKNVNGDYKNNFLTMNDSGIKEEDVIYNQSFYNHINSTDTFSINIHLSRFNEQQLENLVYLMAVFFINNFIEKPYMNKARDVLLVRFNRDIIRRYTGDKLPFNSFEKAIFETLKGELAVVEPDIFKDSETLIAQVSSGGKVRSKDPIVTKERFLHKGRNYCVYQGIRGGKYIKMKGEFVSIRSIKKS